jgi:pyruvate/2-oxoglutarate dehydrogenase complex dihydrolipoamide dehydrogenase (E3) component
MPDHDLAIIGAGRAGLSMASRAAAAGRRVVLFERGATGGGWLHGGLAAQALLALAHRVTAARQAVLGLTPASGAVQWPLVQAQLREAVAAQAAELAPASPNITVIRASAHFTAADRIEAAGRLHAFRHAVIAAGSAPLVPDLPGLASLPWLTTETIFDLPALPGHLLVLGADAAGIEMAQAFARLGCRVSLIEAGPNIVATEDRDLVAPLREQLREDGVTLHENTRVLAAEAHPEGLALRVEGGASLPGSHLLLALGRAARLSGLDLPAAGIEASARGVVTGRDLRSSNRRVWVAGSIADPEGLPPHRFGPAAGQQAGLILRAMQGTPSRLADAALPRAIRTEPELAQIGLTEMEARAAGMTIQVLRGALAGNARAIARGDSAGQVKLVVGPGGRLLGAGILGQGAAGMAGMLALALERRLPLSALAELALPWPALADSVRAAIGPYYTAPAASPMLQRVLGLLRRP